MRVTLTIALSGLLATSPAYATTLDINVEVPKLNVAEYHRPYVAVWLEGADQKVAANLSVWYQQTSNSEGHGTKWLPDLRQWWRKSGRTLQVPVDGVTGPPRRQAGPVVQRQAARAEGPGPRQLHPRGRSRARSRWPRTAQNPLHLAGHRRPERQGAGRHRTGPGHPPRQTVTFRPSSPAGTPHPRTAA